MKTSAFQRLNPQYVAERHVVKGRCFGGYFYCNIETFLKGSPYGRLP